MESKRLRDSSNLAPAALHCPDPSPFQAFHYGIHRALKVLQPDRQIIDGHQSWMHWRALTRCRRHFRNSGNPHAGYAVLGAEVGLRGGFVPAHLDCTDTTLPLLFEEEYSDLDADGLRRAIAGLTRRNYGFLPNKLRRKLLVARVIRVDGRGRGMTR